MCLYLALSPFMCVSICLFSLSFHLSISVPISPYLSLDQSSPSNLYARARSLSHSLSLFIGDGRKEPNQFPKLPPPNRPATSFLWITSPWKSFRYILWGNYKVGWFLELFLCFVCFVSATAAALLVLFHKNTTMGHVVHAKRERGTDLTDLTDT